jgi:uncharacterized protein (UPF0332 family)
MIAKYAQEIAANLERAEESLKAAQELAVNGYYDIVASRTYYTVFYAATALLLCEELEFSKHSGVIAAIHQHFVKTGKLDKQSGKDLNWLFELRGIGDYGITTHVPKQDAERAIQVAQGFLNTVKKFIGEEKQ